MDTETKNSTVVDLVNDYRNSMQPECLTAQLRSNPETANRIYLAVVTNPEGILWQGIRDRVRGIDGMCIRLGHRHVAYIDDEELAAESIDKCVLPFCHEPRSVVIDRFRWGQSYLRGHNRDIATVWHGRNDNEIDEVFDLLTVACTDANAAHFLTLQVFQRHARHSHPKAAMRCAVRSGLVGFEDSFIDERLEAAFCKMLDEANDPDLLPALAYAARTSCHDDPLCQTCAAWSGCWYLSSGYA